MVENSLYDPILFRQSVKHKYSDLVWNAYLYRDQIEKILSQQYYGSINSIVQLFLQYVLKEWSCPNCLQTILPYIKSWHKNLPLKGDITYVSSRSLFHRFPVLICPHCENNIVVIATSEFSDIFEFRYQLINENFFDLLERRPLKDPEIQQLNLTTEKNIII